MWKAIFRTPHEIALTISRITLAIVMFPHGMQKLFGWFGGGGFNATLENFRVGMNIPAWLGILNILTESFGPILLAIGLLSRFAALATGINMIVAAILVHLPVGFFMNWSGAQAGEGFEFHILALGLSLPVIIRGGGAFSVDALIAGPQDRERYVTETGYRRAA
jgi:putative oxidoreductase